jgi:hypothetical protein
MDTVSLKQDNMDIYCDISILFQDCWLEINALIYTYYVDLQNKTKKVL